MRLEDGGADVTGEDLRALSAAATPGPWRESGGYVWSNEHPARVALACSDADAELIVWLRNHADALADLIDAAREVRDDMAAGALDYHVQAANRLSGVRLHEALTALDGTP